MKSLLLSLIFVVAGLTNVVSAEVRTKADAFATPEERLVDAAKTRAIVSQKPVLVLVTAVWCPPCNVLEKAFRDRKAEFDPVLAEYEFVTIEDTWTKRIPYDYVGLTMIGYPSFYFWDPRTDVWNSSAAYGDVDVILEELGGYASQREKFAVAYWDQFLARVKAGDHYGEDDEKGRLGSLALFLGSTLTVEESIARFQQIARLREEYPAQFDYASDEEFYLTLIYGFNTLMGREGADVRRIRELFPLAMPDDSLLTLGWYVRFYFFEVPLGQRMRLSGKPAGAEECESFRTATLERTGRLSAAEKEKLANSLRLVCLSLKFSTGKISGADYIAFVEALTEPQKVVVREDIWTAYAAVGNFPKAVEHAEKERDRLRMANQSRPEILARIEAGYAELISALKSGRVSPNAK